MKTPKSILLVNSSLLLILTSPIFFLLWRVLNFSNIEISEYLSWNLGTLVFNTLSLFVVVVLSSTALGLCVSILTTRYELFGSKLLFTLSVLPLVIPSYIGALTYVSTFSSKGLFVQFFLNSSSNQFSGLSGFIGSWIVLTLFTYPYVLIICTSALRNLDATVEDAARSLGISGFSIYSRVILPRLKQPIIYSGLLVGLYVLSDFGAVSLMNYSTLTKAIYSYYTIDINGDPLIFYSIILIMLSLVISYTQRGGRINYSQKVSGTPRVSKKILLSLKGKLLAYSFFSILITFGLLIPISVLSYWVVKGANGGNLISSVFEGLFGSLTTAVSSSIFAMIIAIPIVVMLSQQNSKLSRFFERILLSLYGLPHIAVGVALLFITIKLIPSIYQTFFTLIFSYVIVFIPQVIGSGKASMEQVKKSYLEASSGLGMNKLKTFTKITFPLIFSGISSGAALVFLSTMKELPQTLLLRPTGFNTLAIDIWSNASEGLYSQASFSSIILLLVSAIPTYILSTGSLKN